MEISNIGTAETLVPSSLVVGAYVKQKYRNRIKRVKPIAMAKFKCGDLESIIY